MDYVLRSGLGDGCAANHGKPARACGAFDLVVDGAILEERQVAFSKEPTRCIPLL